MPTWGIAPNYVPNELLDDSWALLHAFIERGPTFEEVTGVPMAQMTAHARQAAESFVVFSQEHDIAEVPDLVAHLMMVYTLGFIVGMRYGELRHEASSD